MNQDRLQEWRAYLNSILADESLPKAQRDAVGQVLFLVRQHEPEIALPTSGISEDAREVYFGWNPGGRCLDISIDAAGNVTWFFAEHDIGFTVTSDTHAPGGYQAFLPLFRRAPQWVMGTGSDLPIGTQAWVAYRTSRGVAVGFELRRAGGWGWADPCDDSDERHAFPDDGDPDLYLREEAVAAVYFFQRPSIVAYRLQPTPEPPKE